MRRPPKSSQALAGARALDALLADDFSTAGLQDLLAGTHGTADRQALAAGLAAAYVERWAADPEDVELPTRVATAVILLVGSLGVPAVLGAVAPGATSPEAEAALLLLADAAGFGTAPIGGEDPALPAVMVEPLVEQVEGGEEAWYELLVQLLLTPAPLRGVLLGAMLRLGARKRAMLGFAAFARFGALGEDCLGRLDEWLAGQRGPVPRWVASFVADEPAGKCPVEALGLDWPVVAAYASEEDGAGSQGLHVVRRRPDGRLAFASVVVNAWRGLADGVGHPELAPEELQALLASLHRQTLLTAVPAAYVGDRLEQGLRRTDELGLPLPFMLRLHWQMFQGLPGGAVTPPAPTPALPATGGVFQLKIALKGAKPPIWRRVLVPADTSLAELHEVIQRAMGWHGSHLHGFQLQGVEYGPRGSEFADRDEARARLADLLGEGAKLGYLYDFGDSWDHVITVEKHLPRDPALAYPLCLKGKGACPPEDSGGLWGYYEKLDVLADPDDPDHADVAAWMGEGFAPDAFDVAATNARLARLQPAGRKPKRGG